MFASKVRSVRQVEQQRPRCTAKDDVAKGNCVCRMQALTVAGEGCHSCQLLQVTAACNCCTQLLHRFATHLRTWKMSSISCLVAQLTVMLDKSMPVFFSRPFLSQTFSLTLNQMHVMVFSESVFHVENLLYPPDISLGGRRLGGGWGGAIDMQRTGIACM